MEPQKTGKKRKKEENVNPNTAKKEIQKKCQKRPGEV